MKKIILYLLFISSISFAQNTVTISGYIKEKGSQEQLIGVNIFVPGTTIGSTSNTFGYYSLTLPKRDSLTLVYSFVGYQKVIKTFPFRQNIIQNIEIQPLNQLQEVVVSAKRDDERVSEKTQMSQIEIPIQQIKKIPALLGEKDVLKVIQLMPGVQKGSEGSSGIYVRGGGPDQNLLILDDAVVYNASHLFGFFSVFNGDALKSVELTKGGFPARFGGRLSSVIEMNMKEGNKEKLHGEGGIGIIASRLMLEGPIKLKKEATAKTSFLVSARRTYLDIMARPFIKYSQRNNEEKTIGGYYFYDLNAKINHDFNEKNKVYLSGYFGQDRFDVNNTLQENVSNGGLFWGNGTGTLRFNHLYNQKLFSNTSIIFSNYNFQISQQSTQVVNDTESNFELDYSSRIRDWNVKYDFDYYPNPRHAVKFGLQSIFHRFEPSAIVAQVGILTTKAEADIYNVIESGLYAEDTWTPLSRLKINAGVRLSYFKTQTKDYLRPEPRLGAAFKLTDGLALKASYAKMNQFVHLLSNTSVGLPTDLWVPTTDKIAPEQSEQFATGFAKDLDKLGLTLTLEGYYKKMSNLVAYKEGSSFFAFDLDPNDPSKGKITWEDNVTAGKGYSYGVEFLIQKKIGRFSGWIGYTWSKTRWQFDELNFGKEFYPRYDRRNDVSLVGIYDLNKRITFSGVWVYGTGNALTMPTSQIYLPVRRIDGFFNTNINTVDAIQYFNSRRVQEYGEKNSFRGEPYHRLDLSVQFNKKKRKSFERTWEISAYNAYNRRNPFFYQIRNIRSTTDPSIRKTVLQRVSLFPIVPSLTYAFKF